MQSDSTNKTISCTSDSIKEPEHILAALNELDSFASAQNSVQNRLLMNSQIRSIATPDYN